MACLLVFKGHIKMLEVVCVGNTSALIAGWEAETGGPRSWSSEPASLGHSAVANSKEAFPHPQTTRKPRTAFAKVTFYLGVPNPIQTHQQAGVRCKCGESQSCSKITKSSDVALHGQDHAMPGVSSPLAHPHSVANEKNQISKGGWVMRKH